MAAIHGTSTMDTVEFRRLCRIGETNKVDTTRSDTRAQDPWHARGPAVDRRPCGAIRQVDMSHTKTKRADVKWVNVQFEATRRRLGLQLRDSFSDGIDTQARKLRRREGSKGVRMTQALERHVQGICAGRSASGSTCEGSNEPFVHNSARATAMRVLVACDMKQGRRN